MKFQKIYKLLAGFITALALLSGVVWFGWHHIIRMQESADRVNHTETVRFELSQLLSDLKDLETGERGFVITGNPEYLEPFEASLNTVDERLSSVRELTADNPRHQANCAVLEQLINQKAARSQANVDLRRNAGFEAAQQGVADRVGKALMDRIRAEIVRMDAEEKSLLKQRTAAALRETKLIKRITVGGAGFSFVLLITVFATVLRENRFRRRAEQSLLHANEQLERHVLERTAALKKSEDMFRAMVETSPLAIYLSSGLEQRADYINPRFTEFFGYTLEEVPSVADWWPLAYPDEEYRKQIETEWQQKVEVATRNKSDIEPMQVTVTCKDGSTKIIEWGFISLRGDQNIAFGMDITKRTQIEETLSRLNADLENAQRIAHMGNWTWDPETDRVTWSEELYRIFGLDPKRAAPSVEEQKRIFTPESWEKLKPTLENTVQTGESYTLELELARPGGEHRWISACGEAERDAAGQIVRLCGTARDITERKQAEEKIRRLNEELEQRVIERTHQLEAANKELEAFSYSVSHDLRAPLRHVQGYVEMLTREAGDQLSEKARRYLKTLTDASGEMGVLIDDLLSFSRMGRAEMTQSRVDLDLLVQETLGDMELSIAERNIVWKIPPLPAVQGDPAMLKQVFANLLANAVKYSRPRDPAEVEVGIATPPEDGNPDEIALFVRDNGVGFDPQYAHKLFGVFQRLHHSNEFEGTGIGLANVRRIINRHGGRTWAEGAPDKGATFYFTLRAPSVNSILRKEQQP